MALLVLARKLTAFTLAVIYCQSFASLPQPPQVIKNSIRESQLLYGFDPSDRTVGSLMRADGVNMLVMDTPLYENASELSKTISSAIDQMAGSGEFSVDDLNWFRDYLSEIPHDYALRDTSISKLRLTSRSNTGITDLLDIPESHGHAKTVSAFILDEAIGYAKEANVFHSSYNYWNPSEKYVSEALSYFQPDGIRPSVINMSWVFEVTETLSNILGELNTHNTNFGVLKEGYKRLAKHGVIVQSLSNNNNTIINVNSLLGQVDLTIRNSMLTVANVDLSNKSTKIEGTSCEKSQLYCVVMDGVDLYARSLGDLSQFELVSGNSFSAPRLSAMVAILAKNFPTLSPNQWRDRILATAQTNLLAEFNQSLTGKKTFNGFGRIQKSYSALYGFGVPNIKKALLPVGQLGFVQNLNNINDFNLSLGTRIIANWVLAAASFFKYSPYLSFIYRPFVNHFRRIPVTLFDQMAFPYEASIGDFIYQTFKETHQLKTAVHYTFTRPQGSFLTQLTTSNDSTLSGLGYVGNNYQVFLTDQEAAYQTNFSSSYHLFGNQRAKEITPFFLQSDAQSVLPNSLAFSTNLGDHNTFNMLAMTQNTQTNIGDEYALMLGLSGQAGEIAYNVHVGQHKEGEKLLKSEFSGAFALDDQQYMQYYGGNFSAKLSDNLQLMGGVNFGSLKRQNLDARMFNFDQVKTSEWQLFLQSNLTDHDQIYIGVEQPIRFDKMKGQLVVASGIDQKGTISYNNHQFDMSTPARQVDIVAGLNQSLNQAVSLRGEVKYSIEYDNQVGQQDITLGFGLNGRF